MRRKLQTGRNPLPEKEPQLGIATPEEEEMPTRQSGGHRRRRNQKESPVQVRPRESAGPDLQRMYPDEERQIVASESKNEGELSLHAAALSQVNSREPNSTIEAGKEYTGGEPYVLGCRESRAWVATVMFTHEQPFDSHWKADFGGFKVDGDFSLWDFTALIRYATVRMQDSPRRSREERTRIRSPDARSRGCAVEFA